MFHMVYSPGEIALYQRKLNKKGLGGFFVWFFFFNFISYFISLLLFWI